MERSNKIHINIKGKLFLKKRFSALTVGIIAFLMLATGVAAGSFNRWAGEDDFDSSMGTMDKIQVGIDLLMGDLDNEKDTRISKENELADEKEAHEKTKKDLADLKKTISDSSPGKDGEIEDLIADRDKYRKITQKIATEVNKHVAELNEIPGAGPKYKYLVKHVNANVDYLYNHSDIVATERKHLNESPGNGPTDNQLEHAIKDMKEVEGKSGETLDKFDGSMKDRIEQELNQ